MKILFLMFRPFDDYDRKYMIQDMVRSDKYEILYISFIGKDVYMHLNGKFSHKYEYVKNPKTIYKVMKDIKNFKQRERLTIWNAFTFGYWKIYLVIRLCFFNAFVIYDIFDYLYYDEQNCVKLLRYKIIDIIYQVTANKILVHSRELAKIYKKAHWINNASHLRRKKDNIVYNRIGIISSFDHRSDYNLLEYIAKRFSEKEFALYGWVKSNKKDIKDRLDRLVRESKNINYYGAYKNDDLENILSKIDIGLVVYKSNNRLTRYINPNKYFHFLCCGLEVVSTPIESAYELEGWMHICKSPEDFTKTIGAIYRGENLKNRGEFWEENNWQKRLEEVETHVF